MQPKAKTDKQGMDPEHADPLGNLALGKPVPGNNQQAEVGDVHQHRRKQMEEPTLARVHPAQANRQQSHDRDNQGQ